MSELARTFLQIGDGLTWAALILSPLMLIPFAVLALPGPLDGVSRRLSLWLDRISAAAMGLAIFAAVALVLIQIAVIILLSVFGIEIKMVSEAVMYAFAMVFMLGAAATLRDDGHVRVDIFREKMGPKARAGVDLVGTYIFLFPITLLILDAVRPSLTRAWAQFEPSSEAGGLPIYFLFKTLVPVFALLVLLAGLSVAMRSARVLRGLDTGTARHHGAEGL